MSPGILLSSRPWHNANGMDLWAALSGLVVGGKICDVGI